MKTGWWNFTLAVSIILSIFIPVWLVRATVLFITFLYLLNYVYFLLVRDAIEIKREIPTSKLFLGDTQPVILHIYNKSFLPIFSVFVDEYLDFHLSFSQKYSFFAYLKPKGEETVSYNIHGTRRGEYFLGPCRITVWDLFGVNKYSYEIREKDSVIVFPRILAHQEIMKSILQPYGEIRNRLPMFEDVTKIEGLREYMPGDDLRRIHWKLWAKYEKLYVFMYKYTVSSASLIILNLYNPDYDMKYKEMYIEFALELSATVFSELYKYKQEVGLLLNGVIARPTTTLEKYKDTNIISVEIGKGSNHFLKMFEILAKVFPQDTVNLKMLLENVDVKLPWGTAIYVITPNITEEEDIPLLLNLRSQGHEVFVFNIHPLKSIKDYSNLGIYTFNAYKKEEVLYLESTSFKEAMR